MESQGAVKKISRVRKTIIDTKPEPVSQIDSIPTIQLHSKKDIFNNLNEEIKKLKDQFDILEKEITETRQEWVKEQRVHQQETEERERQENLGRKHEQELYQYETNLNHKKAEDEFSDKKTKWEKELLERKDELAKDKQELAELRSKVAGFEQQLVKAADGASEAAKKELESRFENEKRLYEQQVKAEKDVLNLRLSNLTADNSRQAHEIETLKKALDEATRQVKEIAVKVIESNSGVIKTSSAE